MSRRDDFYKQPLTHAQIEYFSERARDVFNKNIYLGMDMALMVVAADAFTAGALFQADRLEAPKLEAKP
jgi:hypothetical protein